MERPSLIVPNVSPPVSGICSLHHYKAISYLDNGGAYLVHIASMVLFNINPSSDLYNRPRNISHIDVWYSQHDVRLAYM
jgi:hypothetical protein